MTTLYMIHHATAVPSSGEAPRELTPEGRVMAAALGEALREHGVVFDAVLTSPAPCAVDTAAAIAAATSFTGEIEEVRALLPGVPAQVAARALGGRGSHVAVVGHDAGLTALAGLVTALPRYLTFKPGLILAVSGVTPLWKIDPSTMQVTPLMLERK